MLNQIALKVLLLVRGTTEFEREFYNEMFNIRNFCSDIAYY